VVDDVEQKTPRHRRRRTVRAEEVKRAGPLCVGQGRQACGNRRTLLLVGLDNLLHRRRRRRRRPFRLAALERVDQHALLAEDLPRNILRSARLRIGTVL